LTDKIIGSNNFVIQFDSPQSLYIKHNILCKQVTLDREKMERNGVERQLADRMRELIDLQARFDAQNAEANAR
jgi:hypothetical protein